MNDVIKISKQYLSAVYLSQEVLVPGEEENYNDIACNNISASCISVSSLIVSDIETEILNVDTAFINNISSSHIETEELSVDTIVGDMTISGNYIQTTSISGVYNFSGRNSFLQAESSKYGLACTGTRGYCILATDHTNNQIKLCGDISEIVDGLEDGSLSDYWSFSLWNSSGTSCFQIIDAKQTETSAGVVTINQFVYGLDLADNTEEDCIEMYLTDDNGLYYPANPVLGNCLILNCYGNHAEGATVKALGRQTHAEGRVTTADIRYSHAEGTFTYAGGMASHAEGYGSTGELKNKVLAMGTGSHAECWAAKAFGQGSHSEGAFNETYGMYSHAEGGGHNFDNVDKSLNLDKNVTYGASSHAEGKHNRAGSKYFDVESYDLKTNTLKLKSVEGLCAGYELFGTTSRGNNISAITGWKILSVNTETNTISVNYIPNFAWNDGGKILVPEHTELGNSEYHFGDCAHVEGRGNIAIRENSHASGQYNKTLGYNSYAQGSYNKTYNDAIAMGNGNSAYGVGSIAIGHRLYGNSYDSNVINYAENSFGWSGIENKYEIPASRKGTFNINPNGGVNGVYIGNETLASIISANSSGKFDDNASADLTTDDGKTAAISAILVLLGMKKDNIKLPTR